MALVFNININPSGAGYAFDPAELSIPNGYQVCFNNRTARPHWPGLADSTVQGGTTYFMPYQIVAGGSSPSAWIPNLSGTFPITITYADSLDTGASRPTGRIIITGPAPTVDE